MVAKAVDSLDSFSDGCYACASRSKDEGMTYVVIIFGAMRLENNTLLTCNRLNRGLTFFGSGGEPSGKGQFVATVNLRALG